MVYPQFKPIVQEVIKLMGQVSGSAVQKYSEPLVQIAVNKMFDYLANKRKWDHLWGWQTNNIGVDGLLTAPITGINTYLDIEMIRDANTHRAIIKPVGTEHLHVTGSEPLYRTVLPWNAAGAETKFFKFWPVGNATPVEIYATYRPEEFVGDDDVVPMPKELMVLGTAWFMLADDGMNPASADKYQGMFDLTYQDIVSKDNAQPIGHGSGRYNDGIVRIQ